MSTAKLHEALDVLEAMLEHPNATDEVRALVPAARAEIDAIERAATVVGRLGLQPEPRDLPGATEDFNERVAARRNAVYLFVDIAKEARIRAYEAAQRSGGTTGANDAGDNGAQE